MRWLANASWTVSSPLPATGCSRKIPHAAAQMCWRLTESPSWRTRWSSPARTRPPPGAATASSASAATVPPAAAPAASVARQ